MRQYNSKNERVKYRYFKELREAECKGVAMIKAARNAVYKYDKLFNFEDLSKFDQNKAITFKKHLLDTPSKTTGESISRTYLWHATRYVKDFFLWLSDDPKYRTKIKKNDVKYFNISSEDKAIAQATSEREYASVDEINTVIERMPFKTEVEKRNKALMSLLLLSGARISALISLKIKHINLKKNVVLQHPKEVKTKKELELKQRFSQWAP